MKIVITGSTKGIGLALALKFLEAGDEVVISSRNEERVQEVASHLAVKFGEKVSGIPADVTDYDSLVRLANFAGKIDIWVNNAGIAVAGSDPLHKTDVSAIHKTIDTNITGTLYGARAAIEHAGDHNLHVFNMEGFGSNGKVMKGGFTVYGTTKRAVRYLTRSLAKEYEGTHIKISSISPGMVVTDLLLSGIENGYTIFNILAEMPDVVANYLVPRMRSARSSTSIEFLSRWKIYWKFMTAFRAKNRLIDENGNRKYPSIEEIVASLGQT